MTAAHSPETRRFQPAEGPAGSISTVALLETGGIGATQEAALFDALDDSERTAARQRRNDDDRRRYIASHALCRALLAAATGQPARGLRFATQAGGRPVLAGGPDAPWFSLSRTRGLVACAVSAMPVGLDIEAMTAENADPALAAALFHPLEQARLSGHPAQDPGAQDWRTTFFRIWTLKEAVLKGLGTGLAVAPESFAVAPDASPALATPLPGPRWHLDTLFPRPRICLSLAVAGDGGAAFALREATPASLLRALQDGSSSVFSDN